MSHEPVVSRFLQTVLFSSRSLLGCAGMLTFPFRAWARSPRSSKASFLGLPNNRNVMLQTRSFDIRCHVIGDSCRTSTPVSSGSIRALMGSSRFSPGACLAFCPRVLDITHVAIDSHMLLRYLSFPLCRTTKSTKKRPCSACQTIKLVQRRVGETCNLANGGQRRSLTIKLPCVF